ncbi:hypothetical protein B296_00011165 [Ensete ventricosum]|uniref:Uncharacterized protein n=1 Tax=Ensete ventricosum TaxID=4639 RepID=A0A426ZC03_ENSVE|nr:hypothetical protein B296_00011165 [Ensete ventricosum]
MGLPNCHRRVSWAFRANSALRTRVELPALDKYGAPCNLISRERASPNSLYKVDAQCIDCSLKVSACIKHLSSAPTNLSIRGVELEDPSPDSDLFVQDMISWEEETIICHISKSLPGDLVIGFFVDPHS